ncbi:MAG TPA: MMPL family transporter [Trebonia sp.]
MAALLYRLGRLAFRRRWLFALMWLAVLAVAGVAATRASAAPPDSLAIPGTESQTANNLLQRSFHANPNGATAQIVFVAPHGQTVTAAHNEAVIGEVVTQAAHSPQVASTVNPFQARQVSTNGSVAIAAISYKAPASGLSSATTTTPQDAARQGQHEGLTVEIGGNALTASTADKGVMVSIVIAAVVLLITFGTLAAAGLPLLIAGVGVGLSVAGITALSSALGLSATTKSLALMLGLAVGIDYALFIVSRYREQRDRGQTPAEAAGFAVGTAGSAVVFAGATVIIALVGLSVIGIPTVTKMGLSAAAAVAVAVLVALTLIPALLGFFPQAVLPRAARRGVRAAPGKPNMGSRWAGFVLRRPLAVLLLAVAGLTVIALPATHMRLGNAGNATLSTSSTERRAYDDIGKAFGPGDNGPLTIVVTASGAVSPKAAAAAVAAKIDATPGVVSVSQPRFDAAGNTAVFTAVPATAPDAPQTTSLVNAIRGERPAITSATGASYLVTGLTAANIDIAAKVSHALLPYILAVVGLAFLLLLVVFRSVLVPLKATLGFVLSLLASLGALVAVFQWGWLGKILGIPATGPIQSFMPIFMVGIAFGLAMDYQVFLVTRIQEAYAHGQPPAQAVITGFGHSARVVAAAALIMTSVFASFVTSGDVLVKMIGFGLAAAVLLDAFVVRATIVPAVLALLGRRAWWLPRWLDRALPHIDIEGQALEHRLAPATAAVPAPAASAANR